METIIKKNEDRHEVRLEDKTLTICPDCCETYGDWTTTGVCGGGCGEYLRAKEKVICSEGRHYCKPCFEQMEKDGEVEPEAASLPPPPKGEVLEV